MVPRVLGLAVPAEVHHRLGLAGDALRRRRRVAPAWPTASTPASSRARSISSRRLPAARRRSKASSRGARRNASCGAARSTRRRHPRFATPRSTTSRRARSATRWRATRFRCATFRTPGRCNSAPTSRIRSRCLNDRLIVTPALRYDYYDLTISPDSIYDNNTPPGVKPSDFNDSAWSPKLSAMYGLDKNWNVYGNYAFGFRAPPFDDVNAAFRNPIQSYVLVPNPDLKSETSQGIEVGVKGDGGWGRLSVAAFYNRYKDFIDSRVALNCPADPLCVPGFFFTFQSVNRARRHDLRRGSQGRVLHHAELVGGRQHRVRPRRGHDARPAAEFDQSAHRRRRPALCVDLARLGRSMAARSTSPRSRRSRRRKSRRSVPCSLSRRPDSRRSTSLLTGRSRSTRDSPPACSTSSTRNTGSGVTSTRASFPGIGASRQVYSTGHQRERGHPARIPLGRGRPRCTRSLVS